MCHAYIVTGAVLVILKPIEEYVMSYLRLQSNRKFLDFEEFKEDFVNTFDESHLYELKDNEHKKDILYELVDKAIKGKDDSDMEVDYEIHCAISYIEANIDRIEQIDIFFDTMEIKDKAAISYISIKYEGTSNGNENQDFQLEYNNHLLNKAFLTLFSQFEHSGQLFVAYVIGVYVFHIDLAEGYEVSSSEERFYQKF